MLFSYLSTCLTASGEDSKGIDYNFLVNRIMLMQCDVLSEELSVSSVFVSLGHCSCGLEDKNVILFKIGQNYMESV